jgi:phospholipase A-2-activating protein
MSTPPYRLRSELYAHDADVRGVAFSPSGLRAATASRDCSIALWDLDPETARLPSTPLALLRGHDHFVNALTFVDDRTIVSASSDQTLRVWSLAAPSKPSCTAVLKGHGNSVCDLTVIPGTRRVVSSSWDMTARVWDIEAGACLHVLKGHTAAVWAAHSLDDGRVVTVAADKSVRVWAVDGHTSAGEVPNVCLAASHTDVVRSIASGPKGGFVTVSNDSGLVLWMPHASKTFVASAHVSNLHDGSFAYSVDGIKSLSDSDSWTFASGGEDNALRITRVDTDSSRLSCVQTLIHPGTVWCVAFCANGDVLTGCSDGVARIFTCDPARVADPEVIAKFEQTIADRKVNSKVIGGVDLTKLPSAEHALVEPGLKDGENKIVKSADGSAEVHMWSANEQKWMKIGDVVDGPGGGPSMGVGNINGKAYDFVFDVDLGQGGQGAKLGYNRGENPYVAAQRFIDDNEINQDFLDEIARFVEQQVPADALAEDPGAASDPLTGSSRYIPASSGSSSRGVPSIRSTTSPVPTLPPPTKYLPHPSGVVLYSSTDQVDKIQSKVLEFNAIVASEGPDNALGVDEVVKLNSDLLQKISARTSGISFIVSDEVCESIVRMLKWPTEMVFPALDLGRLVLAQPSGGAYFFGKCKTNVLDAVLRHITAPSAPVPVLVLGCRFLCNLFANRVVLSVALLRDSDILNAARAASRSENRKARETHGALLVNYAVAMHNAKSTPSARSLPLKICVELISSFEKDEEVLFRLMVAMGTLLCGGMEYANTGRELGVQAAATVAAPVSARVQQVAHEISFICSS